MKNLNIKWITPQISGRGISAATAIRLAHHKHIGETRTLSITLYSQTLKELRWQHGDKVAIGDGGDFFVLKRVVSDGYTISGAKNPKQKNQAGFINVIRRGIENEIDKMNLGRNDIYITDDGCVIIPKKQEVDINAIKSKITS